MTPSVLSLLGFYGVCLPDTFSKIVPTAKLLASEKITSG